MGPHARIYTMAAVVLLGACGRPGGDRLSGGMAREKIGATVALASDEDARLVAGGTGLAAIQYQAEARLVERDEAVRSLAGVSSDGWTLLFDPAGPVLRAVQPGDVLVIKGLLARKVLAIEAQGKSVALLTAPAELQVASYVVISPLAGGLPAQTSFTLPTKTPIGS